MADLSSLIARLEKAEGPDRELDRDIALTVDGFVYEKRGKDAKPWFYHSTIGGRRQLISPYNSERLPAYTSSIDAAVSLAERVLPGRSVMMGWRQSSETKPWARVGHWTDPDATGATPAIALVLATLRALDQKNGEA
ncbi:hypothetical protein [Shinella zoogloeoides]|uniref:hypothetical protein n=1 Tax=Shinella zoogloeoides TaxID=352475 RepID=UPI00299F3425|nr:hypothetical protein [Shinella zoogloeoides]WPE22441.1 hypothetical protein ShzoTeo12_36570 [Shinella zoogloeoides]